MYLLSFTDVNSGKCLHAKSMHYFPLHVMNGLISTQLWVWEVVPAKQMTFRFPEVSSHRGKFHWLKKFCIKQTWLPLQGQKQSGTKKMFKKVLKYCGWWMATHWWSKHRASPTIHLKQDLRFRQGERAESSAVRGRQCTKLQPVFNPYLLVLLLS